MPTLFFIQRGTNENINGLIRRWYKKGTDFSLVSEDKIKTFEWKVNNMPRKMFGYKTAYQMYQEIFKIKKALN